MDSFVHQLAERGIDCALAGDAVEAGEGGRFDDQRKMAFAAPVVAGVADVAVALVFEVEASRSKARDEALLHRDGDRAGSSGGRVHLFYIER